MDQLNKKRVDRVLKETAASPSTIYQAILNPDALVSWLPPDGMRGEIDLFEPWGRRESSNLTNVFRPRICACRENRRQ